MPLSYSEEGEQLADKSPCAEIRARLKMCLLDSDCCKKVVHTNCLIDISFRIFQTNECFYI